VGKILTTEALLRKAQELKRDRRRIVFTNGCFDLLHPGHVAYLRKARQLGDVLIVGLNSDRSVREIKGEPRPILSQEERCEILSGLESVNFVTVFDDSTPQRLIQAVLPDVLVKGGDWEMNEVVGREDVEAAGGKVVLIPYEKGQSTSGIIKRILDAYRLGS
jgi:rfaE bifunctional protein nucleotidyltransferase chain/domain